MPLEARRGVRDGASFRERERVKEDVLRLVVMVTHGFTMCLPCSAKASDNNVLSVCKKGGWSPSRLIINMPDHAAFVHVDVRQLGRCHAFCYTLHHAFDSRLLSRLNALFDPHTCRQEGPNSRRKERV